MLAIMKKLLIICCVAAGFAMPVVSTVRAEMPRISIEVGGHERHPELREALAALEKAKHHLKESRHDFRGHREAALIACENAIYQLKLALESDRD